MVENVGDRVFFATDQSNLDGSARATLRNQAAWLNQNADIRLTIEGHADERGTREYNLALGARRANAVRDFLISEGVAGNRLQTISYGKERPVSLCSEESCWSKTVVRWRPSAKLTILFEIGGTTWCPFFAAILPNLSHN